MIVFACITLVVGLSIGFVLGAVCGRAARIVDRDAKATPPVICAKCLPYLVIGQGDFAREYPAPTPGPERN